MPKIKEILKRSEDYIETRDALGEALLLSSDLESRWEYLMDLAGRQRENARSLKRRDKLSYYLNMADYYQTMAKAEQVREESIANALEIRDLNDSVRACYIPTSEEAVALWTESKDESEDDPFEGTDLPVEGLAEDPTQPFPAAEIAAADGETSAPAPAEPDIDDAS